MEKLILSSTVYTVVEDFRRYNPSDVISHEYYRIAKCKIAGIPNGSLKEYKLVEVEHVPKHLYFKTRNKIQETYSQAIECAEEQSQKRERSNRIMGVEPQILYRHWEDNDGK
jgi:hypothetical protein